MWRLFHLNFLPKYLVFFLVKYHLSNFGGKLVCWEMRFPLLFHICNIPVGSDGLVLSYRTGWGLLAEKSVFSDIVSSSVNCRCLSETAMESCNSISGLLSSFWRATNPTPVISWWGFLPYMSVGRDELSLNLTFQVYKSQEHLFSF